MDLSLSQRKSILLKLGVKEEVLPMIQNYMNLLWQANDSLNLISRKMTMAEFIDNHIIDSFLPLSYFPTNMSKVADFGSGGGLPGVLYALQFPHLEFHLFEKSPKKQEFINQCKKIAPNLHIHGEITAQALLSIDLVMAELSSLSM